MSRIIRTLVATGAAVGISVLGLAATAASPAAASSVGTTGGGSWSFGTFDPSFNYHEGIQLGSTTTNYQAQVQQPINAPGQIPSVFSNRTRTIPVKYVVQKQTVTTDTVYPGLLQSYVDPSVVATNLNWTPPGSLTVGQITNLTANFTWTTGQNHTGSMYWIINTPDGNVWIYYGDIAATGVFTGQSGTGVNMITLGGARAEASQPGLGYSPEYDTLANILAAAPASGKYTTIGDEPVNWIGLAVDEGASGAQGVQLSSASPAVDIGTSVTGDSTYTPGTIPGSSGPWVNDTSAPAWLYLYKTAGSTPAQAIDESLIDNTQGDSGGQFRVVDGMYMYNFPVSQLTDLTASYQFGIRIGSSTAAPIGVVGWGIK